MNVAVNALFGTLILGVAACSGTGNQVRPVCGEPPPTAAPDTTLVYPVPGATNVPDAIGALYFGAASSLLTARSISITSASGSAQVTSVAAAASPLPTPNALVSPAAGDIEEATIAPLAPATTYAVSYSYTIDVSGPPSCDLHFMVPLGSFTTQ